MVVAKSQPGYLLLLCAVRLWHSILCFQQTLAAEESEHPIGRGLVRTASFTACDARTVAISSRPRFVPGLTEGLEKGVLWHLYLYLSSYITGNTLSSSI